MLFLFIYKHNTNFRRPVKVLPPLKNGMGTGSYLVLFLNKDSLSKGEKNENTPFSEQIFYGLKWRLFFLKLGRAQAQGRSRAASWAGAGGALP